jgi:hypothetical protein
MQYTDHSCERKERERERDNFKETQNDRNKINISNVIGRKKPATKYDKVAMAKTKH